MMRSLWSGVAGLKNHQTKMDVIGNNIANVNTVGFKASRVTFQDMLSQTMQGAGSATGNVGGTNPVQVGMGMSVASIDTIFTDGAPQATGKQTDLAISGQGFFQLSNDGGVTKVYSRDGAFDFDAKGDYVVPNTGYKVMGYQVDAAGKTTSTLGPINIPTTDTMAPLASTTLTLAGNLKASATAAVAATAATLNTARQANAAAAGAAAITVPAATVASVVAAVTALSVAVPPSASAADLAVATTAAAVAGATPASVAAAMAANLVTATTAASASSDISTSFKVYDSLGTAYTLNGTFEKTAANTWTFTPVGTITDPTTGATTAKVTTTPATPVTINFSSTGAFTSSTTPFTMTITPTGSPTPLTITPDFSTMTQYDSTSTAMATDTDGYGAGTLSKITASSTGMFVATYTNGETKNKGQVALFSFNNPGGLNKSGGNLYVESNNSGIATKDQTSSVNPGNLEMSNVDLAQQFSDMIVTQRGFQANSKIITTTDSMLEELVNLKR